MAWVAGARHLEGSVDDEVKSPTTIRSMLESMKTMAATMGLTLEQVADLMDFYIKLKGDDVKAEDAATLLSKWVN
jgi:hypothetical protein